MVTKGQKRGTIYMVEVSDAKAYVFEEVRESNLWHQRLGHICEKGMKMLTSKGRLPDLKNVIVDFCQPCVLGKKKKVTFVKMGHPTTTRKLDHSYFYGPTLVASVGTD